MSFQRIEHVELHLNVGGTIVGSGVVLLSLAFVRLLKLQRWQRRAPNRAGDRGPGWSWRPGGDDLSPEEVARRSRNTNAGLFIA